MRDRKVVLFLLTLLVLFSIGCSSNPRNEEGDVDFRRGSIGLEMRFMDGNPPVELYEGDILPINIEMFNRGTAPITDGSLYLTGYDPNIITNNPWGGISGNLPFYGTPYPFQILDTKSQFNTEGGYDVKEFQSGVITLPEGTTIYRIPLVAYACYDYFTLASENICIDPQPHRTYVDKPCITQDVSLGGGQGAPVSVTGIDVVNMRDELKLTFTIQNVGGGDIVDLSVMKMKCPTSFSPADLNVVYVDHVVVGPNFDIKPSCQPNGRIKLNDGYGKVICTFPITGTTAFKTPVEIRISYGYRDYIRQEVEIRGYD